MKACFLLCLLVVGLCFGADAQSGTWVWMNGSDTANAPGHYGVQGVADSSNTPPGTYQAAQWTDRQGNFWVFGGIDCNRNEQNDLWKFDPNANTWTWVRGTGTGLQPGVYGTLGVPAPGNSPGARAWGCSSWTDSIGDLWLFGGCGYDSAANRGDLNDLWKYHIASNEWTWMGGSAKYGSPGLYGPFRQSSNAYLPPSRSEANTAWIDNANNLWIYGGRNDGQNNGFDDMWRYSIATGEWAWMAGSGHSGQHGGYGLLGVENGTNFPGGRSAYAHWTDNNYLYLMGGADWTGNRYNDVWRFNLANYCWTWIGGVAGNADSGQYTHYCSSEYGDIPIGRIEQRSAQINGCAHVLFVWGGGAPNGSVLNDLWSFDLHTDTWRWASGNDSISPQGNYGVKGTASALNVPCGAAGHCFWSDDRNNLWLWGGQSFKTDSANTNTPVFLNAMWKYIPDFSCFPPDTVSGQLNYTLSSSAICRGDSSTLTFIGDSITSITQANTVTWLNNSTAKLSPDSSTTYRVIGITPCGTYAIQDIAINVLSGAVSISPVKSEICHGDTAQICAPAGFTSYSWSNGATTSCISTTTAATYLVTVSENGSCSAVSNSCVISLYPIPQPVIHVYNDTLLGTGGLSYQWLLNDSPIGGATANIYVPHAIGTYTLQVTDSNGCKATSSKSVSVTGVADELMDNSIVVFPNPTNNGWQLNVSTELLGGTAELFDATGRLVFKSIIENQQSFINFSDAARGVYQLRVSHRPYIFVRKLVKL